MIGVHHGMKSPSVPWQTAILTDTDAVAVKPHGDTSVGIAGMDEVTRNIKIIADKLRKGVVGILVGIVGTPVGHRPHLLGVDGVG